MPAWPNVILIPDAGQSPEQLAGVLPGNSRGAPSRPQAGRERLPCGLPGLIDRRVEARNGRARLTSREFLYRPAFELGRH